MSIGFTRKNAALYCDGLAVSKLAAEYGTPLWLYSQSVLEARYKLFAASLADLKPTICYALKANSNQAVIATFAKLGAGADIVSAGELLRALQAGVPPHKIVFAGVGKSAEEMALALDAGILQFNVESGEELARLSAVAQAQHGVARVALRVNPNVDPKTHPYISTGLKEAKFGVAYDDALALYRRAAGLPNIAVAGIDCHIGSQLLDPAPFVEALELPSLPRRSKAAACGRMAAASAPLKPTRRLAETPRR